MGPIDAHKNRENHISLKIECESCCCSHCWPEVWRKVNESIHPQGPIVHEGRVEVKVGIGESFILEQHESGPEIIALTTASIALVTAIVSLISTMLHNLPRERKCPDRIKFVKRKTVGKELSEEVMIEINAKDLGSDIKNKFEQDINKIITEALKGES